MTSRREAAIALANAVVDAVDGDLAAAIDLAERGDVGWWADCAAEAAVGYPVQAVRLATVTVLRDRQAHADPFDSFPA